MNKIKNLTLSAVFIAIGLVLPLFTGQIPQIGNMLLPMHIPVLLCGLICGWQYGLVVGFILPLFRYAVFGMPVLFPTGIAMAFELGAYGFATGLIYGHSKWKCVIALYRALIPAMIIGRVVWGIVSFIIMGMAGQPFTFQIFVGGALLNAVPGIVLQLILIPVVMVALNKTGLVPFTKSAPKAVKTN